MLSTSDKSSFYLQNNYNTSKIKMSKLIIALLLLYELMISESHQQSSISLNTAQWFVKNANESILASAKVPGGIYSDLRRNNILKQDILYGKNDIAYRWVGNENWTYSTTFTIDHQIARSQSVKLVLHGVDTISTITLNGQIIGTTDNMFVRYKFDIKPHLKLAGLPNTLDIKFESPIKYSARKSHQSIRNNRGKIIPPYCPSPTQRGECHVNFIRKMQASFSWDWGPAFPSVGIYKDINIEFGSFGLIRDVLVETRRLPPLIQQTREPKPPPQIIISSSIRQQVKIPHINKTVPYLRAPPFYVSSGGIGRGEFSLDQNPSLIQSIDLLSSTSEDLHQLLEENWLLKITLVAEMVQPSFGYNIRVEFNLNNMLHYESEHINVVANQDGFIRLGFNLRIDTSRMRIKPWWPNNAGGQHLYKLSARMMPIPPNTSGGGGGQVDQSQQIGRTSAQATTSASSDRVKRFSNSEQLNLDFRSKPLQTQAINLPVEFLSSQFDSSETYQIQYISEKEISFGFRTVELIQEPITKGNLEDGLTFNFRVNGLDLFAMGSNWIPAAILPEYNNDIEYIRYLLQSAKDANMNMLRVWGGGLYESDEFYKMADEMGIMIWHDFMFACALYPVDEDFLSSVRTEIEQQVQRLQYHPSIVLWAGNNENEMAIAGPWWPEVMVWNKKLRESYSKLYVDTIRPIVQILDPTRSYIESSPSNGILSKTQTYAIARVPNDNRYGDVHHYDYLSNSFDWTNYPSTRFASEYGFQSYPSFNALTSVTTPNDWKYPLTTNVLHRQHRLTGESEMKLQIKMHFNEPESGGVDKLKSFLYVSQLTQAIAIKTETEFYRRNRFIDPETKLGKTMGALYWQLNDVWQAPTWSSIEYGGKWKMLHYFARRFFFPIQLMPYLAHTGSSSPTSQYFNGNNNLLQQIVTSNANLISALHNRPQMSSMSQQQQSTFSQQSNFDQNSNGASSGTLFVIDLVRDDLFYLLDAFNVTIRFYRWTSFSPVWQDTVYVKNTRPQNVTRIYEQDVARIIRQPGMFSLTGGVFQVLIEQQPRIGLSQIDNYLMPVNPSKVTAMRVAKISFELVQGPFELSDVGGSLNSASNQWSCAYRLTLVSDSIAMFVWLDLNLLNVVDTPPERPQQQQGSSTSSSNDGIRNLTLPIDQFNNLPPDNIHLDALPITLTGVGNVVASSESSTNQAPSHIHLHLDRDREYNNHKFPPNGREENSESGNTNSGTNVRDRLSRVLLTRSINTEHREKMTRKQFINSNNFKPLEGTGSQQLRYQFSDNAFNMFEPSKMIDLYLNRCLSKAQVEAALEVQTLADCL